MARSFGDFDVVHSNAAALGPVADPGVALLAGDTTTEGNAGIIVIGAITQLAPPEQWHTAASSGAAVGSAQLAVLCRPDIPAGESSWTFEVSGGSASWWAWIVEEWTNVSFAVQLASAQTLTVVTPASISSGTTDTFDALYAMAIAAVFVTGGGTGAGAWSPVTWSNGFTETGVQTFGTGSASTQDLQMRVARKYLAAGETGPVETTCTFTDGTQTGKTAWACVAVLRAENLLGDI